MSELKVITDWSYKGLRTVVLENSFLRVIVLPEAGAKIWQITYKPLDVDLLWNNPRIPPARHSIRAPYDDAWSGGWDELFPNDEATTIAGEAVPDHGELWTGIWDCEPFSTGSHVGVKLRFTTPVSSILVEKTITLAADTSRISFHHCFTNTGKVAFPFLWKLHPAFDVTPAHRIDFPAMKVTLEPAFPGTLAEAEPSFTWPYARIGSRKVDLRAVPHPDEQQLYFFYGHNLQDGWCAITNTANGLACGLQFDPSLFSSCWLFASYGGWRNYNVAVLEPCTGYPLNFEEMVKANRHRVLRPGETLATDVKFSAQEGFRSVAFIDEEGTMVEESPEAVL